MKLLAFVALYAVLPCALCACGSGGSPGSGPMDGSTADGGSIDAHPIDGAPADAAAADAPPTLVSTCDNAQLLAGCVVGACTVSATGQPLPGGGLITVAQRAVPTDLNGDTLGSVLCSITPPMGVPSVPNLTLSIALTTAPGANAILFQYVSPTLSRAVPTSQRSASAVVGLVTAPGDFGATERPGPSGLQATLGADISSSGDQASLLLNLSSQPMSGAFYDGTHLFVCNGARLLVYSGIPADPSVKPNVILGQPDLDTVSAQITSSLFGRSGCAGLWSDGTHLVAANGNRILIWNTIPSQNAVPADIVLGQPDFTSNTPNSGGVGATTLSGVASLDSDGTRLAVAEMSNNRVLIWNKFPTAISQPADIVVGQPDFATNGNGGAVPLYQAWGTLFDPAGLFLTGYFFPGLVHVASVATSNPPIDFKVLTIDPNLQLSHALGTAGRLTRTTAGWLAVRDGAARRIPMFRTTPTGAAPADVVLGQPDVARVVSSLVSASTVSSGPGGGEGLGAGKVMLVPDTSRLLVYDTPPTFNFEPASRVVGHAGFTTAGQVDYRGISALTLAAPADVAVSGGTLAVADRSNNRVLLYRRTDIAANNLAASIVLGQPDVTSYVPNLNQRTPSAARLSGPAGVALDGTHLIVADTENHRVLIWNSVPSASATPADLVLGQADFTGGKPNRGRGDQNADGYSDASADGFFSPMGVASDGTHLFVADRLNNRVLVWNTFPTASGRAADAVIGQANFTSSLANRGLGAFTFAPDGLNLPTGVTIVGAALWIADTENNRLVRWDNATTAPAPGAWIGQASGSVVGNANYFLDTEVDPGRPRSPAPSTTSTSILRPRAMVFVGSRLYVSETDSNRVHLLDAASFSHLGELGQSVDSSGAANAIGVTASSLAMPLGIGSDGSTLWVADSANNRVLGYDVTTVPPSGAAAAIVLGQPGPVTNGFDQTSTAARGTMSQPRGVALANGKLYIADTSNNRVLVMTTPVAAGQSPASVYGQASASLSLPNSGGAPSPSTLNAPQGVFVDSTHVVVSDTANNRVLVYDANATTTAASLVLGQASFTTNGANVGGASAGTMQSPTAAYSDGTSLWVADTGNQRVLVWRVFPTSNGQVADLVLGQTSFSGVLPNQGGTAASASSMSFPSAILVVNSTLYIADSGNNRVLSFSAKPTASGASADGVLGQGSLVSRQAAVAADDLTHLAGPVALAQDGENLYVVDRDLARVVVFNVGQLQSASSAFLSIGAAGGLMLSRPGAIAAERTPFFTSRLYVADTGNNHVAIVQSVSRLLPQ